MLALCKRCACVPSKSNLHVRVDDSPDENNCPVMLAFSGLAELMGAKFVLPDGSDWLRLTSLTPLTGLWRFVKTSVGTA